MVTSWPTSIQEKKMTKKKGEPIPKIQRSGCQDDSTHFYSTKHVVSKCQNVGQREIHWDINGSISCTSLQNAVVVTRTRRCTVQLLDAAVEHFFMYVLFTCQIKYYTQVRANDVCVQAAAICCTRSYQPGNFLDPLLRQEPLKNILMRSLTTKGRGVSAMTNNHNDPFFSTKNIRRI